MTQTTTSFLYAEPSWLEGAAKVFDLGGTFDDYNRLGTPEQSDALMLYLDWVAVGSDLRKVIETALAEIKAIDAAA